MLDIWVSTGKIWAQYGFSTGLSWSLFFPHKNPSSTQFSSATGHSCGFWLLPSSWCSSVVLNCRIWAKTRGFHKKPEVLLRFWRTRGLSANPLILKGLAAKGAKGIYYIYIIIYIHIYVCCTLLYTFINFRELWRLLQCCSQSAVEINWMYLVGQGRCESSIEPATLKCKGRANHSPGRGRA